MIYDQILVIIEKYLCIGEYIIYGTTTYWN